MIKPTLKICSICGDLAPLWKSVPKMCKRCATGLKSTSIAKTMTLVQTENGKEAKPFKVRQKPIPKVSDKQAKLNALYKILRDEFMDNHPICYARLQGCTGKATECHHQRGRGKYFLDQSTYIALCHNCHVFINEHNDYAKRFGFVKSRLSKR